MAGRFGAGHTTGRSNWFLDTGTLSVLDIAKVPLSLAVAQCSCNLLILFACAHLRHPHSEQTASSVIFLGEGNSKL